MNTLTATRRQGASSTQVKRQGTNARLQEATRQVQREEARTRLIGNAKTASIKAGIGLSAAVLVAVALVFAWKFATDPRWTGLRAMEVHGAHRHAPGEIAQLSGLVFGKDLVHMDVAGARTRLLSDPWIQEATVSRRWPHRVVLQIRERAPVASLGPERWISSDATVLPRRGEAKLPMLSSRGFVEGRIPAPTMSPALLALEKMALEGTASPSRATILRDGSLELELETGTPRILLRPEDERRALARWSALRGELGERISLFSQIDLRHGPCAALRRAEGGV
jgi:hypothetical protein